MNVDEAAGEDCWVGILGLNEKSIWGFPLNEGRYGEISNGRSKINFILTVRVKSTNKVKLRVFLTIFLYSNTLLKLVHTSHT